MKTLLIGLLKLYRLLISPLYGNVCRYYPSCSAYALEAVQQHGALKGGGLSARRLSRCHPWNLGGYDPVPGTFAAQEWATEQRAKEQAAKTAAHRATTPGLATGPQDSEINSARASGHATRCMS